MEAIECIKTRRSIRKYEDKPVDRSLIEEIIEIARFAPSWKNSQSVSSILSLYIISRISMIFDCISIPSYMEDNLSR